MNNTVDMKNIDVELLLKDLIDIPSSSGQEKFICEFVYDLLSQMPFEKVEKIYVDENSFDIYAHMGSPKVMLQAHLDVVPPHIPANSDEMSIFGRGSCDTKASVATMIVAVSKALEAGINNFALAFTVREETDMLGIDKLVEALPNIPFAIVGEPTQLEAVNCHYGMLNTWIKSSGKAAHTSEPQEGVNAIDVLLSAMEKIKSVQVHHGTLLSIVKIEGGVAENVVPPVAMAMYSLRVSPEDKNDYVKLFKDVIGENSHIDITYEITPAVNNLIPQKLSFLGEGKTVRYQTELTYLPQGIVLGPGSILNAHTDMEHVEKVELLKAVDLYLKIIKAFNNS